MRALVVFAALLHVADADASACQAARGGCSDEDVDSLLQLPSRIESLPESLPEAQPRQAGADVASATISADGESATVLLNHAGRARTYLMQRYNVYASDAEVLEHVDGAHRPIPTRSQQRALIFRSREEGGRSVATISANGTAVSGFFENGGHVLVVRPQEATATAGAALAQRQHTFRRASHDALALEVGGKPPGVSFAQDGAIPDAQPDPPLERKFETAVREDEEPSRLLSSEQPPSSNELDEPLRIPPPPPSWEGTRWWPGCYEGDSSSFRISLGLIVDYPGWQLWGEEVQFIIDQVVAEASYAYENQLHTSLEIAMLKIYKDTQNAPPHAVGCPNDQRDSFEQKVTTLAYDLGKGAYPYQAAFQLFSGCQNSKWGGYAWIRTLCDKRDPAWNCAVSKFDVRNMDFNYYIFMHELGHNFGGYHSFAEGVGTTGGIMDYGDGRLDGVFQFNTKYRKTQMCAFLNELRTQDKCGDKFARVGGPTPAPTPPPAKSEIAMVSFFNKFVRAWPDGKIDALGEKYDDWEKFIVETDSSGYTSFKTFHGRYLSADFDGSLFAQARYVGPNERFILEQFGEKTAIKASINSMYIAAEQDGRLVANRWQALAWEQFEFRPPVNDACHCGCDWWREDEDDCTSDSVCANRCRIANGVTHCSKNGRTWHARRNHHPNNVWENGREKCNCQWMASHGGLADTCGNDCLGCAHECRQVNPHGTCLSDEWAR